MANQDVLGGRGERGEEIKRDRTKMESSRATGLRVYEIALLARDHSEASPQWS
jgi:hypothetical protein